MGGAISTAARCVSSTKSDDFRLDTAIEYVLHPISLPPMEIIAYKGIKIPERFRKDSGKIKGGDQQSMQHTISDLISRDTKSLKSISTSRRSASQRTPRRCHCFRGLLIEKNQKKENHRCRLSGAGGDISGDQRQGGAESTRRQAQAIIGSAEAYESKV